MRGNGSAVALTFAAYFGCGEQSHPAPVSPVQSPPIVAIILHDALIAPTKSRRHNMGRGPHAAFTTARAICGSPPRGESRRTIRDGGRGPEAAVRGGAGAP